MHRLIKAIIFLPSIVTFSREAKPQDLEDGLLKALDTTNQRITSLEQLSARREAVLKPQIQQFNADSAKYDPKLNAVIVRGTAAVATYSGYIAVGKQLATKGITAGARELAKNQITDIPVDAYKAKYGRMDKSLYYLSFKEKPELDARRRALEISYNQAQQIRQQTGYERQYRQLLIKEGKQMGILPLNFQEGVDVSAVPRLWEIARGRDPNSFREFANLGDRSEAAKQNPKYKNCLDYNSLGETKNCEAENSDKKPTETYSETWTMTQMNTSVQGRVVSTPGDGSCAFQTNSVAWHRQLVEQMMAESYQGCRQSFVGPGEQNSFIYQVQCSFAGRGGGPLNWPSLGGGAAPGGFTDRIQIGRYNDQIVVKKSNQWVESNMFFKRCDRR